MAKRRPKGEGGISQRHDHPTCPPIDPETKERPEHKCRGRWMAQVSMGAKATPDGKAKRIRKTIYGPTEKSVRRELTKLLAQQRQQRLVVSTTTVARYLDDWMERVGQTRLKANTRRGYRSKIKTYLVPHLGHHRLDRLEPDHIDAMFSAMRAQGLAEATLRQTYAILHRALSDAEKRRKVATNVAALVDPPGTKVNRRRPLTVAQARKVLAAEGDGVRFHLALYLGMRQGECLGLRWPDVDLGNGVLYVQQSLVRDDAGGGLVLDDPKSQASVRPVPLPTVVLSRLKVAWARHVAEGGDLDGYVFARADGRPLDPRADWQAWTDLLASAGVGHVALHAARNTTAQLLEDSGVPDRLVAQILGQSQVSVTHGYQYADLDRTRAALDSAAALVEEERPELA